MLPWLRWWWTEASPWFFYREKWAGPEYRSWYKFPYDYVSWFHKYRMGPFEKSETWKD